MRMRVALLPLVLWALALAPGRAVAQDECLVEVRDAGGRVRADDTHCREAQDRVCTFQLQACVNQAAAGCTSAPLKKRVKARGKCSGGAKLAVKPDAANPACGTLVDVRVKTKKKGTREGRCTLRLATRSTDRPPRRDADTITLLCRPNPGDCPAGTTSTPRSSTTTSTSPACLPSSACSPASVAELLKCLSP